MNKDDKVTTLFNAKTYNVEQLYNDVEPDFSAFKLGMFVGVNEDDKIVTCWSSGSRLEQLGILEILKQSMVDSMWNEE